MTFYCGDRNPESRPAVIDHVLSGDSSY
jgi:hypothetical protein